MTYGRARLWLGVSGVGSLVTMATIVWSTNLPQRLLSSSSQFGASGLLQLCIIAGIFMMWLLPFDFLGGYFLPAKFGKSDQAFGSWMRGYLIAAVSQAVLFVLFGSMIVLFSQQSGVVGGIGAISLGIAACFLVRNRLLLKREVKSSSASEKLIDANAMIQSWQVFVPRTIIVQHKDSGFTGGIVGFGKYTKIVIPQAWLSFTSEQLAAVIARRAIAVNSGSYTRGLLIAFVWNVCGFMLCSFMPGAGLATVSGLATTVCGFTIWSFLGLLTLPTVSRNASLTIDHELRQLGMPPKLLLSAASQMDQLQDDEPE